MNELEELLSRVNIAGQFLAKAPMLKTKQAAQMAGDETLKLLSLLVKKINEQEQQIEQLKERLS